MSRSVNKPNERRPYHSNVRAEGARRTREVIVVAATREFLKHGYEGCSLADIAAAADVARPTVVAAFGSKPALLSRVLDEALAGDDEPIPVRDRPWFQPVWEAASATEVLAAYAGVCVVISSRAGGIAEVVRRAAHSSPDVAALWESWLTGRRLGAAMVVERDVVVSALRADLTVERAIDVLWTQNDPDLYLSLVQRQGWSELEFELWLAGTMQRSLLAAPDA